MNCGKILVKPLAIAFFGTCVFINSGFGQTSTLGNPNQDEGTAIAQLLAEVRELRVFLQKNGTTGQLAQVALERVRMQQQRVDSLMREQEAVRQKLKTLENNLPRSAETVALWETKVGLAENPNQRADWEQAVRDLRREGEMIKKDLQEYRDRDAQLTARISAESAKLDDLNSRLDIIERDLEAASRDTTQPKLKKP